MSDAPSVGIVTVNYNSASFIGAFLDSLGRVDYPNARLIVVDAASRDGSSDEIARRRPDAHLLRCDENVGIARGNNLGAACCREQGLDYVLFVNNDTTHEPDFLRTLVEAVDERTMAVPRILYAQDRRLISTHAGDFDWDLGLFRHTYHGKPDGPATRQRRELQTASFCCILLPARAFEAAGPLDERFFMYYEETDFLRRALARGYRLLYVPEAVVYHRESASSGGGWMTPFKQYYATRNRLYLVRKHARSRVRFAGFTLYFWATRVPYLLRYALSGQRAMLKATLLGMFHYYRGRMGRTLEVSDF
ncbi:MAG: glycosyltransferase family 2 protein [Chloroflexi bacterium]|nr:glycosyltransferase family 2 protein [Chloroflexota bacterium]